MKSTNALLQVVSAIPGQRGVIGQLRLRSGQSQIQTDQLKDLNHVRSRAEHLFNLKTRHQNPNEGDGKFERHALEMNELNPSG
jgi:hypothetical protein